MRPLSAGLTATSFPSALHSAAGRRFVLPASFACALGALFTSYRAFLFDSDKHHVNDACMLLHLLLCLAVTTTWTATFLLIASGRGTWRVVRVTLLLDALEFGTCAVLLRYLGPPPFYPPRAVTFEQSLERASSTLLFAMLLAPANRSRLATFANNLGWNHVTVTLNQMQHAPHQVSAQLGACKPIEESFSKRSEQSQPPPPPNHCSAPQKSPERRGAPNPNADPSPSPDPYRSANPC